MTDLTVGELIERLKEYSPDKPIDFGSGVLGVPLVFNRVKDRGTVLQIELNEDFTIEGTYTVEFDGGAYGISGPHLK